MKKIILFCYGPLQDLKATVNLLQEEILSKEGTCNNHFALIGTFPAMRGLVYNISEKYYKEALSLGFCDFI